MEGDISLFDKFIESGDLVNACVLMFHIRDIRGGKGRRDLFIQFFTQLSYMKPHIAGALTYLIPEYGSWKDVVVLIGKSVESSVETCLINMLITQLRRDAETEEGVRISLAAKWAPREGKATDRLARKIAAIMFPDELQPNRQLSRYRRLVAGLNRRLQTIEIYMADGRWADIDPYAVPCRAGSLYRKALLNLEGDKIRHPDNEDRMKCRAHFLAHLTHDNVYPYQSEITGVRYDAVRYAVHASI